MDGLILKSIRKLQNGILRD